MFLRISWWISTTWLALAVWGVVYFAWMWLSGPGNPLRHEALMGMTIAAFYSWPALLAGGVLKWRWESPLLERRLFGGLVLLGVIVFVTVAVMSEVL